jgi:hypothetical protein
MIGAAPPGLRCDCERLLATTRFLERCLTTQVGPAPFSDGPVVHVLNPARAAITKALSAKPTEGRRDTPVYVGGNSFRNPIPAARLRSCALLLNVSRMSGRLFLFATLDNVPTLKFIQGPDDAPSN